MPISVANEPSAFPRPRSAYKVKPARSEDLAQLPPDPAFLVSIDPAMNAALAPLDRLAADLERTWGVDRLLSLVHPETAERFAQARKKLDLAIREKDSDKAAAKAAVLCRGWRILDQEARALGHAPDDVGRWCIKHPVTEKAYAVVKHRSDVDAVRRELQDHTVLALDDLIASHMVTFRAQQLSSEPLPDDDIPF